MSRFLGNTNEPYGDIWQFRIHHNEELGFINVHVCSHIIVT